MGFFTWVRGWRISGFLHYVRSAYMCVLWLSSINITCVRDYVCVKLCVCVCVVMQANIRARQKHKFQKITQQSQKKDEEIERNPYFDNRVTQMTAGRGRKQFKFNEPGKLSLCCMTCT